MWGVMAFARTSIASHVTLIYVSDVSERLWLQMHTDNGPYLLCVWYRPPCQGEVLSISSFGEELDDLRRNALGTLLLGDLNVHSKRWLVHASSNSVEGECLRDLCLKSGMQQIVRGPTRGEYLLDLAVTDIASSTATVSSKIADHGIVTVRLNLSIPQTVAHSRKVWSFAKADWDGLNNGLRGVDWSFIGKDGYDASRAAARVTELILEKANEFIPQRTLRATKSTHPWLTDDIVRLVSKKRAAAGTPAYEDAVKTCSAAITSAYYAYSSRARAMLVSALRGSKQWWTLSRELLSQQAKVQSIPALKAEDGTWMYEPGSKADLLTGTFSAKNCIPEPVENDYSVLEFCSVIQKAPPDPTHCGVLAVLSSLDENSGTGPDHLPSRILKHCRESLAYPILLLAMLILSSGEWPDDWRTHWIAPIFKKSAVFLPKNYRGVHLTAQLAKATERIVLPMMMPHISLWKLAGTNQFAYTKKRGSRDVMVLLTMRI